MKKTICKFLIPAIFLILFGCVKQPIINQGQTIDSNSLSQIKLGMNQEQIRLILGSPSLINTFDSNQWTYYFSNAKINERTIKQQGSLELNFQDNRLAQIKNTGNLIVKSADANLTGGTVITKPTQKKRGIFNRIFSN